MNWILSLIKQLLTTTNTSINTNSAQNNENNPSTGSAPRNMGNNTTEKTVDKALVDESNNTKQNPTKQENIVTKQNSRRKINKEGLNLIKHFEGLKLKAYRDVVGILTIGYGSTGPHVKENMVITEKEAEDLLLKDLERFEEGVSRLVKVNINDNEFSALVSFSFNVGLGALERSTLLKMLNAGDKIGAADQFLRWNKAGGKVYPGLTRRREAERNLFLKI